MSDKKQNWQVGDIFLVELIDGKFVLGQIVGREAFVLNSVSCAFFDFRVSGAIDVDSARILPTNKIFSVLFVTRDLLDSGKWKIVGSCPVSVSKELLPYEDLREKHFVGASVRGAGIVKKFLDAFYGLRPWDDWHDPNYLDKLLLSPSKKPSSLVYKKNQS